MDKAATEVGSDVESVIRPSLMANAVPGNRRGLADAFDCVSVFLRTGRPIPVELAQWVAERTESVARVLRDAKDQRLHGLPAALKLVEPRRPGNKGESVAERRFKAALVWECFHERRRPGLKKSEAPARVAEFRNNAMNDFAKGGVTSYANAAASTVTEAVVAGAWKRRREYAPDIPE